MLLVLEVSREPNQEMLSPGYIVYSILSFDRGLVQFSAHESPLLQLFFGQSLTQNGAKLQKL